MLRIYCDVCLGELELQEDGQKAVCKNCGKIIIVPHGYTKQESQFLSAMRLRMNRQFDQAIEIYNEILTKDGNNTGALWGIAMARYGIEYQKTGEHQYRLICHEAHYKSFISDPDVQKAINLSKGDEAEEYRKEAEAISDLQQKIAKLTAEKSDGYDVFLDCNGESESCLKAALRIAKLLESAGYTVLLPSRDMAQMERGEWEPWLYLAFQTAGMMLIVADGAEGFTEEIEFDTSRFLSQKNAPILLAFSRLDEYADIPDLIFDSAQNRLEIDDLNFADNLLGLLEGQEPSYAEEIRMEAAATENFDYSNMLKNARLALEAGNFKGASEQYDTLLNINPEEGQAYWGLLLAELACKNEDEVIKKGEHLWDLKNFQDAIAFSTEREEQIWKEVAQKTDISAKRKEESNVETSRAENKAENQRNIHAQMVEEEKINQKQSQEYNIVKRRKTLRNIAIAAVVVVIAGGILFYNLYMPTRRQRDSYSTALGNYYARDYKSAMNEFEELGDYKDSHNMYLNSVYLYAVNGSISRDNQIQLLMKTAPEDTRASDYILELVKEAEQEAVDAYVSGDYEGALKLIQDLEEIAPEYVEISEYFDAWEQEALDAYNIGNYDDALELMLLLGGPAEELGELVRMIGEHNFYAVCGEDYLSFGVIAINSEGNIETYRYAFGYPDGPYCSVAMGPYFSGAVRTDGTVILQADWDVDIPDVSSWEDCKEIYIVDSTVMALTNSGKLLSNFAINAVTDNVAQVSYNEYGLFITYEDGTAWCSEQNVIGDVLSWTNVSYGEVGDSCAAAVTKDNRLLSTGNIQISDEQYEQYEIAENIAYFILEGNLLKLYPLDDLGNCLSYSITPNSGGEVELKVFYDGTFSVSGEILNASRQAMDLSFDMENCSLF